MMIMPGTRRRRSRVDRKMPEASAGCGGWGINPSSYDELGLEFVFVVGSAPPTSCTKKTAGDIVLDDAVLLFSSCTMMTIIIFANTNRRRRQCGNGRTMEARPGVRIVAFVDDGRPFVN
jgi:hypothetical protein